MNTPLTMISLEIADLDPGALPTSPHPASSGVLGVDQVAALLRGQPNTVREAVRAGRLPGLKFGNDWVFPVAPLISALDAQAIADAKERRAPRQPMAVSVTTAPARGPGRSPPRLPDLNGAT